MQIIRKDGRSLENMNKPPYSLDFIESRYDADHDIHDDGLLVDYTDFVLLQYVKWLVDRIGNLQDQITHLHEELNQLKLDKIVSDLAIDQVIRDLEK